MSARPSFLAELQRRRVYKVGARYGVTGWLLAQIATQVFPYFDISNPAVREVVLAVLAGLSRACAPTRASRNCPEGPHRPLKNDGRGNRWVAGILTPNLQSC